MKEITIPLEKVYKVFDNFVDEKKEVIENGNDLDKILAMREVNTAYALQIRLLTAFDDHTK